jgi:hypothetical protein
LRRSLYCLVLLTLPATAAAPPTPVYDPNHTYAEQKLRGWTLKVNKRFHDKQHDDVRAKTLELLDDHLYRITRVVPADALTKLRAGRSGSRSPTRATPACATTPHASGCETTR